MLKIYFTENKNVYEKLKSYLSGLLSSAFEILKTENGKPYIEGDPLFFSLSHSRDKAVIAISDKPVGVDLEVIADRNYKSVLSRFPAEERSEISTAQDFLKHWVVREAYIKMAGSSLSKKLGKLSYLNGTLYDDGVPVQCELQNDIKDGCIYCICTGK